MGCMILLGYFIEESMMKLMVQAKKHWSSKLDHVLDEEHGALESCEVEVSARRSRASWLEQVKVDNLQDRNCLRSGLAPLPVWKRKIKKYTKRKANASVPNADKRRRVEETSKYLKVNSPENSP